MTPELHQELAQALRSNDGQLGKVFALLESGSVTNRELVDGFAAANQGAAANLRVTVKAVLDGVFPSGPSVAAQSRRSIGGLIRDNPGLSEAARSHLEDLRTKLESIKISRFVQRTLNSRLRAWLGFMCLHSHLFIAPFKKLTPNVFGSRSAKRNAIQESEFVR